MAAPPKDYGRYPEGCEIYRKTLLNIRSLHCGGGGMYRFPKGRRHYRKVRGKRLLVTYSTKEGYHGSVESDYPKFEHVEAYAGDIELEGHTKRSVMNQFIKSSK